MGGIRTDHFGRTSLRGLYAAGEAACTGVHGANRLASNSLLEGLVFGARAAQSMLADGLTWAVTEEPQREAARLSREEEGLVEIVIAGIQSSMWVSAGLLRSESMLREGMNAQNEGEARLAQLVEQGKRSRRLSEAVATSCVARAILDSALARTESRGAHFRNDYPKRNDEHFLKHSILHRKTGGQAKVIFERW